MHGLAEISRNSFVSRLYFREIFFLLESEAGGQGDSGVGGEAREEEGGGI